MRTQIGLDPAFTIHDREDSADLMNLMRHELGFSKTENRFPAKGTCLADLFALRQRRVADSRMCCAASFPWCAGWAAELQQLFAGYVEAKQRQNVLDYDDLLLYWAQMVSDPALPATSAARFDHVLVDEYQDTNRLQASILLASEAGRARPHGRRRRRAVDLFVSRRDGAQHPRFPGAVQPAGAVITLDRNYRSTQPILAAANGVIDLATERFTKNLWTGPRPSAERPQLVSVRDETDQADYIVERVLENREGGTALKQQAVLFRTSHHSGPLEVELTRRNIPFVKFGGLKFLDAAHVKDMLALLRFVENPRDRVAGFRVMQLLPGIGPTSAAAGARLAWSAAPMPSRARACRAAAPPRQAPTGRAFVET